MAAGGGRRRDPRSTWAGSGAVAGRARRAARRPRQRAHVRVGGTEGLVSMRFDGTDRKVVVRVAGPPPPAQPLPPGATPPPPPPPDEVLLSPDGRRALVARRQQRLPDHRAAGGRTGAGRRRDRGLGRADGAPDQGRRRLHRVVERRPRPRSIRSAAASSATTSPLARVARSATRWRARTSRRRRWLGRSRGATWREPRATRPEEAYDGVRGAALRRRRSPRPRTSRAARWCCGARASSR